MFRIARWSALFVACGFLLLAGIGCGGNQTAGAPSEDDVANQKVEAMKRLADAMEKDANGAEARGELENFRNTSVDVIKSSKQIDEINDIYRQRIQGKYKGFVAQEIQGEMGALRPQRKKN